MTFRPGDRVIYRKPKTSTAPGPRAANVHPTRHGEDYHYEVDKFWVVQDVRENKLLLRTRRGKEHLIDANDPNLRRAAWWERLLYARRFPPLQQAAGQDEA